MPNPSSHGSRGTALIGLLTALIGLVAILLQIYQSAGKKKIPALEAQPSMARLAEDAPVGVEAETRAEIVDSAGPLHAPPSRVSPPAGTRIEPRPTETRIASPPVAAPPERTAPPPAPAADPHVKVMYDYRFELNGCEAGGPRVTCRISVTSLKGDRRLMVGGFAYLSTQAEGIRSAAYTADGSDHFAAEASLGSRAERGAVTGSSLAGVPMAATVVFDGVPAGTSAFTALRVAISSERREFLVPFESVPIR